MVLVPRGSRPIKCKDVVELQSIIPFVEGCHSPVLLQPLFCIIARAGVENEWHSGLLYNNNQSRRCRCCHSGCQGFLPRSSGVLSRAWVTVLEAGSVHRCQVLWGQTKRAGVMVCSGCPVHEWQARTSTSFHVVVMAVRWSGKAPKGC